ALSTRPPPAANVVAVEICAAEVDGLESFRICDSEAGARPTPRIAPDLAVCDSCLSELFEPGDRRHAYPYINCTNCGPRFSIVRSLPYDRPNTTMAEWTLCARCAAEYHDPGNRRFHAQPVACPACGPHYRLTGPDSAHVPGIDSISATAGLLRNGRIVAIKGIGGYHLACDAENAAAVKALRERKYRKEQPFAVMVRDESVAEDTVWLTAEARELLASRARPIVLAPARVSLPGVAPDNH